MSIEFIKIHIIVNKIDPKVIPQVIIFLFFISLLKGTITPQQQRILYPQYRIPEVKNPLESLGSIVVSEFIVIGSLAKET